MLPSAGAAGTALARRTAAAAWSSAVLVARGLSHWTAASPALHLARHFHHRRHRDGPRRETRSLRMRRHHTNDADTAAACRLQTSHRANGEERRTGAEPRASSRGGSSAARASAVGGRSVWVSDRALRMARSSRRLIPGTRREGGTARPCDSVDESGRRPVTSS